MKKTLRQLFKKTPLYFLIQQSIFWKWTEEDEQRLKFYQEFIKPGDLVYDVGANVGNRTKVFLKLGARVVAFEPQNECADFLKKVLKKEPNFTLVRKAVGDRESSGQMFLGEASVLSTLSEQWMQFAKESGRFDQHKWNRTQPVLISTLDKAIQDFGVPSFIKIDVEGYEFVALSGLSQPIDHISIEFAAESIESTLKCIDYISLLSPKVVFQISQGESMRFDLTAWVPAQEIKQILSGLVSKESLAWGDIYMRTFSG
jgi:FkbM family methyltransferase